LKPRLLLATSLLALAGPANAQVSALDLFTRADKGYCIACHQLPEGRGPATRADIGPKLQGARMRELGREKLRAVIQDPSAANPQSIMPPFGRHRILEPAEIQSLVEYLHALP
jgi:sulfur-oxidizing protein SoxX